jgi:Flp pilus assembly protein TadG
MFVRSFVSFRRKGAITPLAAITLIGILAMLAFAVDLSWIVTTQSELQNAADASALAGAQQLMGNFPLANVQGITQDQKLSLINSAIANARATAKQYAAVNNAGGKASLTLLDSDIDVGFTDGSGNYKSYADGDPYPNTVKVLLRRDSNANTPLSLFFGPVLGVPTVNLSAPATATLYEGVVDSFRENHPQVIRTLPMTYDVNAWKHFLATGMNSDGVISVDASGSPTIQVYPSIKDTGNFGELSLDDSHNGASTINGWINNGVAASDVNALTSANLMPLSAHNPNAWDWLGNPGFKATNVMNINNYVGQIYWLPLFKPYDSSALNYQAGTGNGSNYNYNIVAFVPVKILPPTSLNQTVIVQPAYLIDPNAVFNASTVVPAGTSSSSKVTTLMPPRLTR